MNLNWDYVVLAVSLVLLYQVVRWIVRPVVTPGTKLTSDQLPIRSWLHQVREEQHDQQLFWYDKITGEFLAQGYSIDHITTKLSITHTKHMFIIELDGFHVMAAPDYTMIPIGYVFDKEPITKPNT
jgi:hypothetical protein